MVERTHKFQFESLYDDQRIIDGDVSQEEYDDLETRLISMYLERARDLNIPLIVIYDKSEYEAIKESGELLEGNKFYMYMDKKTEQLQDMRPIMYHLLDTEEGLFYSKLRVQENLF